MSDTIHPFYDYASRRAGCTSRGFKGRADKTYYRRVRRPLGTVQS